MATVTYLDALSSGMKARIDPTSRLLARREPAYMVYIPPKDVSLLQSNRTLWPITRQKLYGDLKIRTSG